MTFPCCVRWTDQYEPCHLHHNLLCLFHNHYLKISDWLKWMWYTNAVASLLMSHDSTQKPLVSWHSTGFSNMRIFLFFFKSVTTPLPVEKLWSSMLKVHAKRTWTLSVNQSWFETAECRPQCVNIWYVCLHHSLSTMAILYRRIKNPTLHSVWTWLDIDNGIVTGVMSI